jgi:quercetin dioxygenase-like cupin family protein
MTKGKTRMNPTVAKFPSPRRIDPRLSLGFVGAIAAGLIASAAAQAPTAAASKFIAKGKDAPVIPVALWMENGKPMVLRGADAKNAPPSATVIKAVFYNLDGPSYRRVIFPAGAKFSPPSNTADTLLYVVKGRVEVKLGDEPMVEVGPNDAFRERAGVLTQFHALEESELVETNVPAQPPK